MRKFICLSVLSCFVLTGWSQSKFGIFAGPQLSTARYTISGAKQSPGNKYGFQLGGGWKIPFENKLFFSPAFFYSMKGYKVTLNKPSFPPDTLAINNNTQLHTFELAFLLQYDFSTKANHFFLKGGPSLDFQLAGNEKYTRRDNSVVDQKMKFSFGDYGRYAASLLVQLGYESSNGFFVFGQYSFGMGNFSNADGGPRIVHRVAGISVGKYLHSKK